MNRVISKVSQKNLAKCILQKKLSIDLIVLEKMKGDCKKSTLALIGSSNSPCNHCLISYQIKCIKKIGKPTFILVL